MPYRDPTGSHPDWRPDFVRAGIDDQGTPAFDALFQIMAATAQCSLDIRCLRCARLGEDEAWLLQLIGQLQRGEVAGATAILADWLPPAAARIAFAPAHELALAMLEVDLRLPHRHAEAATVHRLAPAAHASRGLALVH